jgi:probable rRNA maturation factor
MKVAPSETPSDDDRGPELLNRQRGVRFEAAPLRAFFERLAGEVAGGRSFTVCLVSDRAMRRYNRRFRGINRPTDVLAFEDGASGRAGDLLISAETARRQARRLGHALETELEILALHGLLHLLGFDHESRRDTGRMARAEGRWRRRFGLPRGLIDRARKKFPSPKPVRRLGPGT